MNEPEPLDLDACLRRAQDGDRDALDVLLTRHLDDLRAYVRLRASDALRARDSTADFVQSVCREVLESLPGPRFEHPDAFREWLYRAAEHKIVDRARYWNADRRERDRVVDEAVPIAQVASTERSPALTPSGAASVREQIVQIERALERLSPSHREVILLSRFARLSHAEIAERLGKSEGAVRTMLSRALSDLAQHLE
jgi:RNA polymerase sigma-70 factor, ECF subfamily